MELRVLSLVAIAAGLLACSGNKESGAAGSAAPSASANGSAQANGATSADEPDPSPLAIVVTSPIPVGISKLEGGVFVHDQIGKHLAVARDGKDLEERPAPTGLPEDIKRVQYAGGRLPNAIWLSVATPRSGADATKKGDVNPFYMLESKANAWKPITEDWQPLVVAWSDHRVLSMSTSSGSLKIKTLAPYSKTPLPDQPSVNVPDPACAKSLKLADAVMVTPKFVLGVGRCKLGDAKQPAYVALRWLSDKASEKAPEKPRAPPPIVLPSGPIPDDPPEPPQAEEVGVPMTVTLITSDRSQHRALAVHAGEAFIASATESGESRLFSITDSGDPTAIELPKLEGPLLDIAVTDQGELYLVTKTAMFKRADKTWTPLPAPRGVELEHADAAGGVVWITGARGDGGVVMRLGPGSATLTW
ncbi:MAG: hypothetical protein U0414_08250 [Polyangiaceae bacterium]